MRRNLNLPVPLYLKINKRLWYGPFLCVLVVLCGIGCRSQKPYNNERLANAASPYIREHADNPVDWYPWGKEALDKARKEGKPLMVTIGYTACHWCHVMEEESFMDTAVASYINAHFIPIIVDREERPDIDLVYMDAVQLITGSGGWPLNAFALPDGRPFHAVTYMPKKNLLDLLKEVTGVYEKQFAKLEKQADELSRLIATNDLVIFSKDSLSEFNQNNYRNFYDSLFLQLDHQNGGLTGAPKFPLPVIGEFLLQYYHLTGETNALRQAEITLQAMSRGGVYDQAGGGFFRYATDKKWKVPHFEKMLFDNAQLVSLYSNAFKLTGNESYRLIVEETLSFINREMAASDGGFYSSLDADSDGEEGKFYTWTLSEFEQVTGSLKKSWLKDYYSIGRKGNWENEKNVLFRSMSDESFIQNKKLNPSEFNGAVQKAKSLLYESRTKRKRPARDEKIISSWNALMLEALLDAYTALDNRNYLEQAMKTARFLEGRMDSTGRLWRTGGNQQQMTPGFLDDYANLAAAFIRLYETDFDLHWLTKAGKLTDYALLHFYDPQQEMFYFNSDQIDKVVARKLETTDNILPSSNAIMAEVLYKLGHYWDHPAYIDISEKMVQKILVRMRSYPEFRTRWAWLAGLQAYQPFEVAIMGPEATRLNLQLQKHFLPNAIFLGGEKENLPLLENKLRNETTIYVCREKVCKLPVEKVEDALSQMNFPLQSK